MARLQKNKERMTLKNILNQVPVMPLPKND